MANNYNQGLPPLESNAAENPGERMTGTKEQILATSNKEIAIGVGLFLGLMMVFVFARNAFVNYLVGTHKRSPNSAGMAGWGLFGSLLFIDLMCSIALVNSDYLTSVIVIPLSILSMIFFVVALYVAIRK